MEGAPKNPLFFEAAKEAIEREVFVLQLLRLLKNLVLLLKNLVLLKNQVFQKPLAASKEGKFNMVFLQSI
ncbi:MAG: hypothetical protein ACT6SG_20395 [Hydrogenophaga sp.]|uniref:hypothetical protein n=1 Tax=Hydrogenophaga sp. TaxID=1904254 RepID=UPI00403732A2